MEFWSYYRTFRRRRWLIVGAIAVALASALVITRPGVGDYEATATLSVPSGERALLFFGASDQSGPDVRTAQAVSLLRSRDLAIRVIQRFAPTMGPDDLLRGLRVERDRGSGLIRLTATGSTPTEAATLANAVADTAAAYDQQVQSRESTLNREFIETQVDAARAKLRAEEDALLAFKQQNESTLTSPTSQQVTSLGVERQQVDLSLNENAAKLSSIRAQMGQQSATRSDREITDNPVAQQLRTQLVGLEVGLTSELAVHTTDYPGVIALRAKIQAVKDQLSRELSKIVSAEKVQHNPIYDALLANRINLETEKVALLAKREALLNALGLAQGQLPGLDQTQMEQSRLSRNVDILNKEYADLQGRLAQARLREQEAQNLGSLAVMSHARTGVPAPIQGKLLRLLLASMLGLVGGVGLAYFLDYLDNGLKTPENAERLLGVPALVAIPRHNPPFDEAYRILRASVMVHAEGGTEVIAITSPRPRSGTSTVVANLACAFAQGGWRTLIVDGAFQRPTQHAHFNVPNDKGLSELLLGNAPVEEALLTTDVPNLRVLPSGPAPSKMRGLLGSPAMVRLLADLKQHADVILVDSPPLGAFADSLTLAPLVTGMLLVLDARQAPRGVEERVKAQLDRAGANILGSVLTYVRPDLVDSYVFSEHYANAGARQTLPLAKAVAAILGLIIVAGPLAALVRLFLHRGPILR